MSGRDGVASPFARSWWEAAQRRAGVAGLIVPVSRAGEWDELVEEIREAEEPGAELRLEVTGCWWRTEETVWPAQGALRAGAPVYLATPRGGQGSMVGVRCALPLLRWEQRLDRNRLGLVVSADPERFRRVRLEWDYQPMFDKGWRYATWSAGAESDDPAWWRHGAHHGCTLVQREAEEVRRG